MLHHFRQLFRLWKPFLVAHQVGDSKAHLAGLAGTEDLAGAAYFQVLLRDGKSVLGGTNYFESFARELGQAVFDQQDTKTFARAAADAPA